MSVKHKLIRIKTRRCEIFFVSLVKSKECTMIKKSNLVKTSSVLRPILPSDELIHYLQIGGYRWFQYKGPQEVIILYNIDRSEAQTVCNKYRCTLLKFIDMDKLDNTALEGISNDRCIAASYPQVVNGLSEKMAKYCDKVLTMIDETMDMKFSGKHRYITRLKLYHGQ